MDKNALIDFLVAHRYLEPSVAQDILAELNNSGQNAADILANHQVIASPNDIWQIVASALGVGMVDLSDWNPPTEILRSIPSNLARLHGVLPIADDGQTLTISLINPLDENALQNLRYTLERDLQLVIAPDWLVESKIESLYGGNDAALDDIINELSNLSVDSESEDSMNAQPVVRYVDLVMLQAIRDKASDIHFEPFEDEFKIRYRVDGSLLEINPPPASLGKSITARLKVLSNMNTSEHRIPQDGRIVKQVGDRQVDMRVNSLPTQYGESVVTRILDRSAVSLSLEQLNLPKEVHEYIVSTVRKPNGIFIVTGPTGAGKTTTLYAGLQEINNIDEKILTAEDPVEYDIDGIMQVQTNEGIDLDFPKILRAFLRQDPDKIMVGEMRDFDTAQIAIQASLTGHLVLSTLHTNDAAGAVSRLLDMGVEPFLVSASLEGILAQRLVRTICSDCKVAYEPSESILRQLGLSSHEVGDKNFFTGQGCDSCNGSGYKGRQGLFELLKISDPIRELIISKSPSVVIKQKAVELGMQTLREDGLRNIYEGHTTIEEVLKYT